MACSSYVSGFPLICHQGGSKAQGHFGSHWGSDDQRADYPETRKLKRPNRQKKNSDDGCHHGLLASIETIGVDARGSHRCLVCYVGPVDARQFVAAIHRTTMEDKENGLQPRRSTYRLDPK